MKIVGLTGSIAMGKSEVAKIFREQGVPVFDADAEVHNLYDSKEGAALLSSLAPEATKEGRVNREILTQLIMKDSDLLTRGEKLVHAEIGRRRDQFLSEARKEHHKLVVLDIPLLFEKALEKSVAKVIVVSATAEAQRERALARPGMTQQRLDMILARQIPDGEKCSRADFVVENNGSLTDLKNKTLALLAQLRDE